MFEATVVLIIDSIVVVVVVGAGGGVKSFSCQTQLLSVVVELGL